MGCCCVESLTPHTPAPCCSCLQSWLQWSKSCMCTFRHYHVKLFLNMNTKYDQEIVWSEVHNDIVLLLRYLIVFRHCLSVYTCVCAHAGVCDCALVCLPTCLLSIARLHTHAQHARTAWNASLNCIFHATTFAFLGMVRSSQQRESQIVMTTEARHAHTKK